MFLGRNEKGGKEREGEVKEAKVKKKWLFIL